MNNLPDFIEASAPPQTEVLQPYAQNYQVPDMSFFTPKQPNTLELAGQGFNSFVAGPASDDVKYQSKSFDWKRSNADRYVGSDYYHELGFDPEKDNESLYGYRQTWGNTVGNAIGGAWKLGVNGFVDGWKGWGRMGDALMHLDWSKLAGDEESLRELNDTHTSVMNKYAIYATPESEAGFWNRKTFGNFLQQSGFTLGVIAQTATEQVLTKVIEGLIAIPTGGAGSIALEAAADAKALNAIKGLTRAMTIEKAAKDLNAIGSIWKDRKGVENLFSMIGGKIPVVGIVKDMRLAKNMGASGKTIAMVGIGGVKRGLSELNLATTEARMEAAGTYGNMYDQLYYEHLDRTGDAPMGTDLEEISKAAFAAGKDNFVFNAALLSAMNRIQFDNMFKSFKMGSRMGGLFAQQEGAAASRLLEVSGKVAGKNLTQFYRKGTLGTLGVVGRVAKDFGRGRAAAELGKSTLRHIGKWEVTEGLQELLQSGSNDYFTEYYLDMYNGTTPDTDEIFNNALDKELSMQGLKTFMSGALTGMITSGPTKLVQKGFERFGTTKKERQDRKTAIDGFVTDYNGYLRSPATYLNEITKNFNIQAQGSEALDKALKNKNKFAFENIKTTMLGQLAARAVRMGTHEALVDTLKDYGKHMSKEEFEQAFVGFGFEDKNKTTAGEYVNNIAETVESYIDSYKLLHENLDNKVNPDIFPKNSIKYKEAQFAKQAQDSVIEILAGNALKAQDSLKRMTSIHQRASANKAMGASLADTFTVMGSEEHTKNEISMLKQEIKSMGQAPGMDRESAQILKEKKEQLEALEKFKEHRIRLYDTIEDEKGIHVVDEKKKKHSTHKTMEEADAVIDKLHEESVKELYDGFKTFVTSKNRAAGITHPITNTEYDEHFGALNDYIKLNKKAQQHTDAYNLLINPRNFSKLHERLMNGARSAAIQNQIDSLNRIMGMRGFVAANPELIKKIKELDNKVDKSEEDIEEYYKLLEEIVQKAAYYSDVDNKAYEVKLTDIIMNNAEFADQNKQAIDEINMIAILLEKLDPESEEAKELEDKFKGLTSLLYDKAEEYLAKHGQKTTGVNNTGTTQPEAQTGTPAGSSNQSTPTESTVENIEKRRRAELKKVYPISEGDNTLDDLEVVLKSYDLANEFSFISDLFKNANIRVSFDGKHAGGLPKIASIDKGIIDGKLSAILTINKSRFDSKSKQDKLAIIAHEFVHGLIALKLNEKGDIKGTSFYDGLSKIFEDVKSFYYSGEKQTSREVYDLLNKNFSESELNDLGGQIRYIEGNIEEFATLGLTEPTFVRFLTLVKGTGTVQKENLWSKLSKIVADFLGVSNTKFNELLDFISSELDTDINYTDQINAKSDAELAALKLAPEVVLTPENEIELIIDEQIAEINKATTPRQLNDLREGLANMITQNPNSPLAKLDTQDLQRIVEAINNRIAELPIFVSLENYNVIRYKDGDVEYIYQVTGTPTKDSVDVREYPSGSQTTYKLTADQINQNTVNVYKNGSDFKLATQTPVTPEEQEKAAETKDTGKEFFADGGAITKAIAQADDKSFTDIKNELLASIGCE